MEGLEAGDGEPAHATLPFKLRNEQCNVDIKLQNAVCNVDVQGPIDENMAGSASLQQIDCAETLSPLTLHMSCPSHVLHQGPAVLSCAGSPACVGDALSAHAHSVDPNTSAASAADDKKLQYTLRSNPKRSRRFLDPDYALELASPLAPYPSPSAGPVSSSAPTGPAAITLLTSPASGPALAAPIKKANSLFSEKARACTECGKQFPSWKALFGHMRCHPERQWRGIQPPASLAIVKDRPATSDNLAVLTKQAQHIMKDPVEDASTAAIPILAQPSFWDQSDSDNPMKIRALHSHPHVYDVEESDTESIEAAYMNGRDQTGGPKMQNARGRRSKRSLQDVVSGTGHFSESCTPPDEVMDERDMADCLVMLSFAAKSKADETSDGDSGFLDWKNHMRESSLAETRKLEMKEKKSYHGRAQKSISFLQEGESILEKWDDDYEKGSWDRKSRFECSTCKKTFRSHQALGGHRASHKKVKGCFARTNVVEEAAMTEVMEMTAIGLSMATPTESGPQQQWQEEAEEVLDAFEKQRTEDQEEQGLPQPAIEEMSMGQFLQFSITCNEKMEEDQPYDSAIAAEKLQLKHQTSSCSSSSSIIAATAAAGTLLMHHQHPLQQSQQLKIHQCTICHRVFSTGQALGGHKRCHWGGSGMLEIGKKCPLMRQDSDGGVCMGISTSEKSSEMSRKGRQDSGSFASAEVRANASPAVTEKDLAHLSGLGIKGRQDSIPSCEDTKVGYPSAHSWLGGCLSSDRNHTDDTKMSMGSVPGAESKEDASVQRGWIEALCANRRRSSKEIEGEYDGMASGGWLEARGVAAVMKKGCECSSHEQKGKGAPALKVEELLDLNLPAPVDEEEEQKQQGGPPASFRRPLPSQQCFPEEERVGESAGS